MPLTAQRLGADEAFARHGTAWRRLALAAPRATFFMLPSVFRAWHRTLSAGVAADVIVVCDGAELVGVLPVMAARVRRGPAFIPRIDYGPADRIFAPGGKRPFPIRQLSPVLSWQATSIRPLLLCHPDRHTAVSAAIAPLLARAAGIDQIVVPVREGAGQHDWCAALSGAGLKPWVHTLERQVLTVEHARPFDAIVADQNSNFRKNIRRARAASEQAGIGYTMHVGRDAVRARLGMFAQLAAQSWKEAPQAPGQIAIPYRGPQQRFFEALLDDREAEFLPALCVAETAAGPIAAVLSAVHGPTQTMLVIFRNDQFPKASPGHLIIGTLIDWAVARGVERIDLNATQDWLRHVADSHHVLSNVAAFRPTARGRLYSGLRVLARRLRG